MSVTVAAGSWQLHLVQTQGSSHDLSAQEIFYVQIEQFNFVL